MADWLRGEITTRKLVALINGLPDDNALERAMNPDTKGVAWTIDRWMLWQICQALEGIRFFAGAEFGEKGAELAPKPREFPWTPIRERGRTGGVPESDQAAAVAYLMGLK